ncbi:MAG: DUF1573 domain-containing protein [Bacteroidales bacterium]|nr:DUF1573 domain-containing protein [Bacteroidales bacterium]
MKKFIALLSFLLIVSVGLFAQQDNSVSTDSIAFEKTVHDYGTISQGADGHCEFKFVNNGKKPLIINEVRASCGCTVPDWTREPILPGKTGVIKAKYNTAIPGNFNKSITVRSNAANSVVILRIKGQVVVPE